MTKDYTLALISCLILMCVVQNVFPIIPLYGISSGPSNKSLKPLITSPPSGVQNQTKLVTKDFVADNKTHFANVVISNGSSFPDNNDFFVPSNLTIEGNTTVIWTNNDTVIHTVTSGNPYKGPSNQFDSSIMEV